MVFWVSLWFALAILTLCGAAALGASARQDFLTFKAMGLEEDWEPIAERANRKYDWNGFLIGMCFGFEVLMIVAMVRSVAELATG